MQSIEKGGRHKLATEKVDCAIVYGCVLTLQALWEFYAAVCNPASFCNAVGFRTSPGRIPVWLTLAGWYPISVQGPMALTV